MKVPSYLCPAPLREFSRIAARNRRIAALRLPLQGKPVFAASGSALKPCVRTLYCQPPARKAPVCPPPQGTVGGRKQSGFLVIRPPTIIDLFCFHLLSPEFLAKYSTGTQEPVQ